MVVIKIKDVGVKRINFVKVSRGAEQIITGIKVRKVNFVSKMLAYARA